MALKEKIVSLDKEIGYMNLLNTRKIAQELAKLECFNYFFTSPRTKSNNLQINVKYCNVGSTVALNMGYFINTIWKSDQLFCYLMLFQAILGYILIVSYFRI